MTILETRVDDSLTLALEGRLDTVTSPELQAVLDRYLPNVRELTLDFGKLDYISSAGLRTLLHAHRKLEGKGGMKICNVNELVREVFEVTGFTDLLNIV